MLTERYLAFFTNPSISLYKRRGLGLVNDASFDPEQAARITVPTLLLIGEDSTDPSKTDVETVAAALPNARIGVLAGQQHLADVLAPEVIAEHLVAFLRDGQQ